MLILKNPSTKKQNTIKDVMTTLLSLHYISHLFAVLVLTISVHSYCQIDGDREFIGANYTEFIGSNYTHCKTACENDRMCNYLSYYTAPPYTGRCILLESYDSTAAQDSSSVSYVPNCCTIYQLSKDSCKNPPTASPSSAPTASSNAPTAPTATPSALSNAPTAAPSASPTASPSVGTESVGTMHMSCDMTTIIIVVSISVMVVVAVITFIFLVWTKRERGLEQDHD
eukprot:176216_1